MSEQKTPYADTIRAFHDAGINFVMVGGMALFAHAPCTISNNLDLVYSSDPGNLERLAAFLSTIHARVLGRPADDNFVVTATTLQRVRFLNLSTDLGEIDLMREIAGIESFAGLWERAVAMDMGGFTVRVASLDDLITMKRAANRPKDQLHLLELMQIKALHAEGAGEG